MTKTLSFSTLHRAYLNHITSWLRLLKERLEHVEQAEHHKMRLHRRLRRRRRHLSDDDENTEKEEPPHIKVRKLSKKLIHHATQTRTFYQQANALGRPLFIDRMVARYRLNKTEQDILLLLVASAAFDENICGHRVSPYDILRVLYGVNTAPIVRYRQLFYANSRLRRNNLIQLNFFCSSTLADGHMVVSERLVRDFLEEQVLEDSDVFQMDESFLEDGNNQTGLLQIRKPRICLSDVQLPQAVMADLQAVIVQYQNNGIFRQWGMHNKIPYGHALSLLFYGPPGTGKTMSAEALAHAVSKPLGVVDYSQVMNKWVGESEKYVRKIFAEARRTNCVLLFDECDTLLQTRIQSRTSVDRMTNGLVNLLLQELEAFEGMVILTTNRADALDPALERRLVLRVPFALPDVEIRVKLWKGFFTRQMPLAKDVDFAKLAKKYPLPGGDMKNVVLRVVRQCLLLPPEKRLITTQDIEHAAQNELKTRLVFQSQEIGF